MQTQSVDSWIHNPVNERLSILTKAWIEKLHFARKAKKEFHATAEQCRMFYKNSQKFWSDSRIRGMFIKDDRIAPKFELVSCKAFELVALYGPLIYWRHPQRRVAARKPLPVIPQLFDPPPEMLNAVPPPGVDPNQFQQQHQQQIQQYQMQMTQQTQKQETDQFELRKVRADLQERVLNWLPTQQKSGGLAAHSQRAVREALVTGRGTLWTSLYKHPGSDQVLTGSFYDSVDNLLIDPDCNKPDLSNAYWIAREIVEPVWVTEQKYGWPKGSLKGNMHSHEAVAEQDPNTEAFAREQGQTQDMIKYHVIYSKGGVGRRFRQDRNPKAVFEHDKLLNKLDEIAGDHAMLAIAEGVPCPLNLPGKKLEKMKPEEVREAVKWPIEFWRTGGWPVKLLDFYEDESSPWPIAPLKPAMGELVFMNIMLSAMAERAWESSRELLGVARENYDNVVQAMGPNGDRIVKLDNVNKSVNEVLQYLQSPQVNFDVWRMLDRVAENMEERTGINDLMHGKMTTQDRSAEATATRREQMNLRPDDMSAKVEAWMTETAKDERLSLYGHISGQNLQRLLQPYGSMLWDKLISTQDFEEFIREMDVTIEAHSARKPNKQREVANIEQMAPVVMPFFGQYAATTGDTRPTMWMLQKMADSLDWDMTGLQIGQMVPPPPPPQVQQQQQQQQQAEQASKAQDAQVKGQMAQAKLMESQLQMQRAQLEHAIEMREMQADQETDQLRNVLERQEAEVDLQHAAMEAQLKEREMMTRLALMQAEAQMKQEAMQQQQLAQSMGPQIPGAV